MAGLLVGAAGGVLAGLAGVGGGLIYVPFFYAFMPSVTNADFDDMGIVIFASLVSVWITGMFSAQAHWKLGNVHLSSLRILAPGLAVFAAIGLWYALYIPKNNLLLLMALLDVWVLWDLQQNHHKHGSYISSQKNNISLRAWSIPIGGASGALGIGGGTMLMPLLRRYVPLRQAVGTSAACGMLMAAVAIILNITLEDKWLSRLSSDIPFLFSTWLGIVITSRIGSKWSAYIHVKYKEKTLRFILSLIFGMLAAYLFLAAIMTS
ncbi:MAG: sulfite exporter TauE/SafE family protein [Mariprofundales bacterium]